MNTLRERKNIKTYKLILDYLNKYNELFDDYERDYLLKSVLRCRSKYNYNLDYLREIYDELGLIPDDNNIYIGFSNFIKKNFDIENKNILEVGGGTLPRLAKRIINLTDKGTITVYDPRISKYEKDTDRLILKRENFNKKIDVRDKDLIIGLMPCKGAEPLIESAVENNKDFIVGLCEGGPHGDCYDFYESDEEWIDCMKLIAREGIKDNNMGKFNIKYLNKKYNYKYPIIYNSR